MSDMIDISASGHYVGDCRELLKRLPDRCVQTCVTSPPYWGLRDYGHAGQLGLESSPDLYVAAMVDVFREVRRVLRGDGTLWLNLGDSYSNLGKSGGSTGGKHAKALHGQHQTSSRVSGGRIDGLKPKDLVGIPWMVAFALRADGWYLRSDIVWSKPNTMPESVTDRPTKAHEYVFLMSKSERYRYDHEAIKEPAVSEHPSGNGFKRPECLSRQNPDGTPRGSDTPWSDVGGMRNARSVWTIMSQPLAVAHFAVMPSALAERCVLAGSSTGDVVLDPFFGSGTVGMVAEKHGRKWIGFDLSYEGIAKERTAQRSLVLPQAKP